MRRMMLGIGLCLLLAMPLAAQDTPYCGQLAAVDCALLRDGQQSLLEMHAATLNRFAFNLGEGTNAEFSAQGRITTLALTSGRPHLALADVQAEVTLAVDYGGLAAELPAEMALDSVDLRLIDGVLYLDLDSLEPASADLHGWISLDLKQQMPGWFVTETPASMTPGSVENAVTGEDLEQLQATFSPAVLDQFVRVTRHGDVFDTQVDFAAMYAQRDFQTLLRQRLLAYWQRHGRNEPITDQDLDDLAVTMADLYPNPLTLVSLDVDPATHQARSVHYQGLEDLTVMIESGLGGYDMHEWLPATFELALDFEHAEAIAPVTVPDDAQPLTEALLRDLPVLQFWFGPLRTS